VVRLTTMLRRVRYKLGSSRLHSHDEGGSPHNLATTRERKSRGSTLRVDMQIFVDAYNHSHRLNSLLRPHAHRVHPSGLTRVAPIKPDTGLVETGRG
jgi:hypothetical protein